MNETRYIRNSGLLRISALLAVASAAWSGMVSALTLAVASLTCREDDGPRFRTQITIQNPQFLNLPDQRVHRWHRMAREIVRIVDQVTSVDATDGSRLQRCRAANRAFRL